MIVFIFFEVMTPGKEAELCTSMMVKAHTDAAAGNQHGVFSAFANKELKGYLYVEVNDVPV